MIIKLPRTFVFTLFMVSNSIFASPKDLAIKIHNKVAGYPPPKSVLTAMENLISSNQIDAAIKIAMNQTGFYNVVLPDWFGPWSNQEQVTGKPLNDFIATLIGAIKDNRPFDTILYDDIIYQANSQISTQLKLPAYNGSNNNHYEALQTSGADLSSSLVATSQSEILGIADTAGVLTTRAAGEAFFQGGTNRRVFRFAMINFMCRDMEELADTSRPDFRVRRDIERNPGGEAKTYKTKCVGCHAGMDAFAGAFSYFEFKDGRLLYQPKVVQAKYNQNPQNFPYGFITKDDSWLNLWTEGSNEILGWGPMISGNGAKSFGKMLSQTSAFPKCMARKALEQFCNTPTADISEITLEKLGTDFVASGYNMKSLISQSIMQCLSI